MKVSETQRQKGQSHRNSLSTRTGARSLSKWVKIVKTTTFFDMVPVFVQKVTEPSVHVVLHYPQEAPLVNFRPAPGSLVHRIRGTSCFITVSHLSAWVHVCQCVVTCPLSYGRLLDRTTVVSSFPSMLLYVYTFAIWGGCHETLGKTFYRKL